MSLKTSSLSLVAISLALPLLNTSCKTLNSGVSDEYPEYAVSDVGGADGYNPYPSYEQYTPADTYTPPPTIPSYTPPKPKVSKSSVAKRSSSKPRAKTATAKRKRSHTVVSGDSLYRIALRNKTTVSKLKAANNLRSDVIRPGQKLVIP